MVRASHVLISETKYIQEINFEKKLYDVRGHIHFEPTEISVAYPYFTYKKPF